MNNTYSVSHINNENKDNLSKKIVCQTLESDIFTEKCKEILKIFDRKELKQVDRKRFVTCEIINVLHESNTNYDKDYCRKFWLDILPAEYLM